MIRSRCLLRWFFLGMAATLPLFGCRPSADPSVLSLHNDLLWTDTGKQLVHRLQLSSKKLGLSLQKSLSTSPSIRWHKKMTPQKGLYQLVLSMQIHFTHDVVGGVSDAALSRMTLALETTLLPALEEHSPLSFREERSILYRSATSPPLDQLRRWASELVTKNARSLTLFAKMQPLTNAALLARLKQGNETEQRHAALLLGQRGERSAIPSLLALLEGDETPRINAVIGSLVRLKAKEAVIPMIRLAPRASSVFLRQLVSALAELGGVHAEGFLDLISIAHQNQDVRQTAKEAFLELRQRDHGLPQDASLSKHLKEKRESR